MIPYKVVQRELERLFEDRCTVYGKEINTRDPETYETIVREEVIHEDIACRLSFDSEKHDNSPMHTTGTQTATLFVAPDIEILEGSRVVITKMTGAVIEMANSDAPPIYGSHRQYKLTKIDRAR